MTVAHSTLTGADLHEPKGVASATANQIYLSDGAGSGDWTDYSTLTLTGMVADFIVPVAPSGWLECDGTTVSRTTYAALFAAVTIQQTCTKTSGSAVITGLSSTANMKAGYYVSGTSVTANSTIVSVDSATQITISANAVSSGSSTLVVSPWNLGDGSTTFVLPNTTTSGRYRRSRTSSVAIGVSQADQNQAHTHTFSGAFSGTTSSVSNDHTHTFSGTSSIQDGDHFHTQTGTGISYQGGASAAVSLGGVGTSGFTGGATGDHTHTYSGTTSGISANHTHTFSGNATGTTASSGSTEARPLTLVVMTCVKT